MGTIASLIVKIGAQDQEIQDALAKLGQKARSTDADLKKLGNTPLADAARKSLDNYNATLLQITTNQQRMAERATDAARGLDSIGGPAKLTKGELDQVNRKIQEGLDAYRALGQEAPRQLQRVAAAVSQHRSELEASTAQSGLFGKAQDLLTGAMARFAGPAALGLAVKQSLEYADGLKRMSDQTGIGVVGLQKLAFAAGQSGNDLDQITQAISQMENRLSGGDQSAVAAVRRLNLSFDDLRRLSPDEQFIALGEAIARIPDPLTRTQLAIDLFGKSGAQVLPTLTGNIRELTNQASDAGAVLDEKLVFALDRMGDRVGGLITQGKVFIGTILGGIILKSEEALQAARRALQGPVPLHETEAERRVRQDKLRLSNALAEGPAAFQAEANRQEAALIPKGPTPAIGAGPSIANLTELEKLDLVVKESSRSLLQLTTEQRKAALAAFTHGQSVGEATKTLSTYWPDIDQSTVALEQMFETYKKGEEFQKKFTENERELDSITGGLDEAINSINGAVVEEAKRLLALGATHESIAIRYGLTKIQVDAIAKSAEVWNKLIGIQIGSGKNLTEMLGEMGAAAREFDEKGLGAAAARLQDVEHGVVGLGDGLNHLGKEYRALTPEQEKSLLAHEQFIKTVDTLSGAFVRLAQVSGGSFGGLIQDIATIITGLDLAIKSVDQFREARLKASEAKTPQQKRDAQLAEVTSFVGGLAAIGQTTGSGGTAGRTLGGALTGAQVGSLFGPIGTAIGGVTGGLTGLFRGLFGNSPEKQINPTREQFVQSFKTIDFKGVHSGLDVLNQKAHDAGVTLDHLLLAKNVQQYQVAVDELTAAFAKQDHQVALVDTGISSLQAAVQTAGGVMPEALRPMVASLLEMKGLTDDQRTALEALTKDVAPDFEGLEQRAQKFGISIQQLGPAFEQAQIERRSKEISGFLDDATRAGGDVGGMLFGLSDEISQLVVDSEKFGSAIPENMRPFIQNLADTGQLLDENGGKITDLTGIKWEDTPLDKGTNAIVTAIHELRDTLLKLPGNARDAATGIGAELGKVEVPTIDLHFRADLNDDALHAATGGYVTAHGIQHFGAGGRVLPFLRRGSDSVPAMLTPGEMVLTAAQQDSLGNALGSTVIDFATARLEKEVAALRQDFARLMVELPERQARLTRDAVQKVPGRR